MALAERHSTAPTSTAAREEQGTLKRMVMALGLGLVTGASDDDPSGIGTYAMAGAALGYAPLWMALVTYPLMAGVQFICAKIGLVYGCGLAGIMRRHLPALADFARDLRPGDRQYD
jgi:Mn2+/Fe2+ NRAMP family transporter